VAELAVLINEDLLAALVLLLVEVVGLVQLVMLELPELQIPEVEVVEEE
jgi:hypothetical protein